MTALIVWGSILLFLLILLMSRATVIIDYSGDFRLKIKYFGITVLKIPNARKSKKKVRKKKKSSDEDDKKDDSEGGKQAEEDSGKDEAEKKGSGEEDADKDASDKKKKEKKPKKPLPTFDELMELLRLALNSLGKPLKRILKRVTFSHLSFTAMCGGSDAAKAAINYGAVNMALSSVLNLIDTFFTLKSPDNLRIDVDFYKEKTDIDLYCEVRITLAAVLAFPFSLIGRAIRFYLGSRGARSAIKKLLAKPKQPKEPEKAPDKSELKQSEKPDAA